MGACDSRPAFRLPQRHGVVGASIGFQMAAILDAHRSKVLSSPTAKILSGRALTAFAPWLLNVIRVTC